MRRRVALRRRIRVEMLQLPLCEVIVTTFHFRVGGPDIIPLGTQRCRDVESTSVTLIHRRNNVVYPAGYDCDLYEIKHVDL